jgi:hypothetical protein
MSEDLSLGHQITMQLMPVLMIVGAIMSLGANFWLPPMILIAMCFTLVMCWFYTLKHLRFKLKDLRFLILPILIFGTGFLTYYHLVPAFYDQAYHLQISNRILDRWAWEPTHQGMSYSFRPEILSGIAAVELWMTGETSTVFAVPTLILISAAWSIQHLAERFSDWRFGFIAGAVFCTFPVALYLGRTMLLDFAVAGMIVSVLHHLEMVKSSERPKLVLIGALLGVIGLTKYAYLYLGGWVIVVFYLSKKFEFGKYISIGYAFIIGLFLLKNQIHTGWIFGPLQSQVAGTMSSIDSVATNTKIYTPHRFLSEFIEQWPIVLFCIAIYGTALLMKKEKQFLLNYWVLVLPAILLHGHLLNFGWPRYSTPWLALLTVGLPAAIWHSKKEFGEQLYRLKIPSILIGILVLTSVNPIFHAIDDMRGSSEELYDTRKAWTEIYENVGFEFDQIVIITSRDTTMGLFAETPCFRYEDQEFPMLQAINKFQASHVFTQDSDYMYDIDINSTFLFGSPIEPVKEYTSNERTGRLWEVNSARLDQSDWWRNSTIEINGSGEHYADFIWLEGGSNFNLLENTAISKIYETDSKLVLAEVFDVLSQTPQNLLCDSSESCISISRSEHHETNWAVWMVKTDS